MNRTTLATYRALALLTAAMVAACQPSDPCDPGFREELSQCVPIPVDAAHVDASAGDGEDDDAGAEPVDAAAATGMDECVPGEGPAENFGASCMTDDDCACPAPVCLPSPLGYCSQGQCQDDPDTCPSGFTCFEVPAALQQDGITHICLRMAG